MALIKSALELALERTKSMKADPAALESYEMKQEGQRIAGEFLSDPESVDLKKRLGSFPKEKQGILRTAIYGVLAARLQLPASKVGIPPETMTALAKGFSALAPAPFSDKRVSGLLDSIGEFFTRYLEDAINLEQALRKQYAPTLQRKEQELAARTGQAVRLDPLSDPEFVKIYQQNVTHLKAQYQTALDQAKGELSKMIGIEKE
jgi:hypothetical protein